MSAWSDSFTPQPVLGGASGELISVRITVEPHQLEDLLEALAGISFPVNPQLHHQAVIVGLNAGGRRESKAATLVEFPAYQNDLPEVRSKLEAAGFGPGCISTRSMLDDIQSAGQDRADVPWLVWQDSGSNSVN